jgi:hypothetical protein
MAAGACLTFQGAAALAATPSSGDLRCPNNMALVGKTCVDRYEGTLVEVLADGREVPFSPHLPPNGHSVKAKSVPGMTPQAHISMVEAQRACKAAGKRLCHAKEWKTACRGPENTKYPYGESRVPGACVDTNRTSPIQKLKGGRYDHTTMNDPVLNTLANTVEPTGSTASCTNGFGVHDMVGNVHEWADDGSFHGGYYLDTKINGEGCTYKTSAHAPTYYDYSTGFRCCADADKAPADDEPTNPNDVNEPVAALDSSDPSQMMSHTSTPAPGPSAEDSLRAAYVAGEFHDGTVTLEELHDDLVASRDSRYPA